MPRHRDRLDKSRSFQWMNGFLKDETGVYGDLEFTVTKVDPARRIVYTAAEMFGAKVRFEMNADDLAVVY